MSETAPTTDTKWIEYQDSLRTVGTIVNSTPCLKHSAQAGEPCFPMPVAICGNRFRDWARGHGPTG